MLQLHGWKETSKALYACADCVDRGQRARYARGERRRREAKYRGKTIDKMGCVTTRLLTLLPRFPTSVFSLVMGLDFLIPSLGLPPLPILLMVLVLRFSAFSAPAGPASATFVLVFASPVVPKFVSDTDVARWRARSTCLSAL